MRTLHPEWTPQTSSMLLGVLDCHAVVADENAQLLFIQELPLTSEKSDFTLACIMKNDSLCSRMLQILSSFEVRRILLYKIYSDEEAAEWRFSALNAILSKCSASEILVFMQELSPESKETTKAQLKLQTPDELPPEIYLSTEGMFATKPPIHPHECLPPGNNRTIHF